MRCARTLLWTSLCGAVALLGLMTPAQAEVLNASFASPNLIGWDGQTSTTVTDWTAWQAGPYGGPGVINPTEAMFVGAGGTTGPLPSTASGYQCVYANNQTGLYQKVGVVEDNKLYSLTVAMGKRLDIASGDFEIALRADYYDDNDYNLAYFNSASTPGANYPASGAFVDNTTSFDSSGSGWVGHDLYVAIYNARIGAYPNGTQCMWSNVRLTTSAIPEPSTLALVASGMMALLAYAWRKRK